jgi:thiol-disulfide isomerase/thioredoxin
MKHVYTIAIVLVVFIALGLVAIFSDSDGSTSTSVEYMQYREVVNPSGFINTDESITIGQFVGRKVVLIDFMTYSCINCQRTLPYLHSWYEKYSDKGLQIIAIHTPEFAFEKDIENVRKAAKGFDIKYPIVLDNDYSTWRAYENKYWPRKYLIDIHGNIVYDHIGEGAYDETEMKIQELLEERANFLGEDSEGISSIGIENEVRNISTNSPEVYFGFARNEYLTNGVAGKTGEQEFTIPNEFILNKLYLKGTWNIQREYAESVENSSIFFRYKAKEVYFVAESDNGVEIEIWQDGELVDSVSGESVSGGSVFVQESQLYKLIKNTESGEHLLEIRVKDGSLHAYTFTFG